MKKLFVALFIACLALFVRPEFTFASCPLPFGGSLTFSSGSSDSCSFYGVDGVDNANSDNSTINTASITLPTNTSITLLYSATNSAILSVGSIFLTGGTITIQNGAKIEVGGLLYVTDSDADGWPDNLTMYDATASGRRRLGLMRSLTTVDCNPVNYNTSNVCCTATGNSCSSDGVCCSGICGTNTDGDGYFSATQGHTGSCQATSKPYTDCNDGSSNVYTSHAQCYTDHDSDGYTVGLASNSTCLNSSSCATATYASASTDGATSTAYSAGQLRDSATANDCNDNDARYHPNAGCSCDSGFDYDCSGSVTKCVAEYTCGGCTTNPGGQAGKKNGTVPGIQAGTACGSSGNWWINVCSQVGCDAYGCYAGTICPSQTTSTTCQTCH